MKLVITETEVTLQECNVPKNQPIFAKRDGKFKGMIVQEKDGWILKLGGVLGSSGYYSTRKECLEKGNSSDYRFYVEE